MTDRTSFNLHGRIALVTGASRGIGFHLARELAKRGAHIIAVARTIGGLEELDDEITKCGSKATLVPLDLHDMKAIDRLGNEINERWHKLDILVANAGVLGAISPVAHVEATTFEDVVEINLVSQWRLIRAVEPVLRRSDCARAILFSSGVVHKPRAFWGPYAASKAAFEVLGRCWADEVKNTAIKVNMASPGATRTAMRAQAMPGEDPDILPTAEEIAKKIVVLASPDLKENGRFFDARKNRFLDYHVPD
ncbi:SDR family NAD(P)-dependent oxidoreductase [uncultured Bartonella sp.]|uniref:SDR family NAD(P)-dependent oxidoreductase n=1 Tax=uncultured Bartonella sp. TaxID=104108 RepID=UPI0025D8F5D2|nr:SDR family NAD(P)-dependent oxidoreductase [uncultured Bartonella sp.]